MSRWNSDLREILQATRAASRALAGMGANDRTMLLRAISEELIAAKEEVLAANVVDVEQARIAGQSKALLDRLRLDSSRFDGVVQAVYEVSQLPDPLGLVLSTYEHPKQLRIRKIRVPLGVVFIVYEARPNVTVDAAVLCLRAGNAVVLRGGNECLRTNAALIEAIHRACKRCGLPDAVVTFVDDGDRALVQRLLRMDEFIDVVIPRGGESLINAVVENSRIPVIKHYKGVCHVFVDSSADLETAKCIVINAKCQRPGVCNAMETLLVHQDVAQRFLPVVCSALAQQGVEIRGDEASRAIVSSLIPATAEDWTTEYLDLILSLKVVSSIDAAIEHINTFGSHHSDAIVTANSAAGVQFLAEVDSAAVYVNASTRFTDGGEFGLGAEIGISTDKLHARGPMGVEELTTYKFMIEGSGQVRE